MGLLSRLRRRLTTRIIKTLTWKPKPKPRTNRRKRHKNSHSPSHTRALQESHQLSGDSFYVGDFQSGKFRFDSVDAARRNFEARRSLAEQYQRSCPEFGSEINQGKGHDSGYVYVADARVDFIRQSLHCVKVGFTSRKPERRVCEINLENCVYLVERFTNKTKPTYADIEFNLQCYYQVTKPIEVEQSTHLILRKWNLWSEVFCADVARVQAAVKQAIDEREARV